MYFIKPVDKIKDKIWKPHLVVALVVTNVMDIVVRFLGYENFLTFSNLLELSEWFRPLKLMSSVLLLQSINQDNASSRTHTPVHALFTFTAFILRHYHHVGLRHYKMIFL